MGKLFGTDGVRGIANKELTSEIAYRLGKASAYILTTELKHKPKILVGMDTRISGHMLEAALTAGICSVGAEVISLGVVPTPAVAYLTRLYKADAGVVISASHNSYEFNGIKFFDNKGYKLSDELEEKVENLVADEDYEFPKPEGKDIGKKSTNICAVNDYVDFIVNTVKNDISGLKVVIDCANGAAFMAAPEALNKLGVNVKVLNSFPNGININNKCGSTHMGELINYMKNNDCDVGLAFDGDADRVLAVDENGDFIDGDKIMAIIGNDLKAKNMLKNNTIVSTVMSNLGFDIMAKDCNINLKKTKVGDRYVLQEMIENDFVLGGEQSGHVIFLEYNSTGDGLLTAVQLLSVMKSSNKPLSSLSNIMQVLPQVLLNAKVLNEKKNDFMNDEVISDMCIEIEKEFQGNGRVLIRPSGTEPLVRVMIEGKDKVYIEKRASELVKIIEERLC